MNGHFAAPEIEHGLFALAVLAVVLVALLSATALIRAGAGAAREYLRRRQARASARKLAASTDLFPESA